MAAFHYADVLIQPHLSEKSNDLMLNEGKYVFQVSVNATKLDVARAIKERFNVDVVEVNIINLPRKKKRVGRHEYMKNKRRKAIIALAEGQRIAELTEAV
ncbi:50S ribosomal protein L23 [bacterium]|nr:50S ribosomal protein L23 [bacterium]MCB1220260.1 50S ribosomal protein L23 [bacterium]UNM07938.1 MAG: 50S ribosomal protein L23 [Planctomycetales bacterium]